MAAAHIQPLLQEEAPNNLQEMIIEEAAEVEENKEEHKEEASSDGGSLECADELDGSTDFKLPYNLDEGRKPTYWDIERQQQSQQQKIVSLQAKVLELSA